MRFDKEALPFSKASLRVSRIFDTLFFTFVNTIFLLKLFFFFI